MADLHQDREVFLESVRNLERIKPYTLRFRVCAEKLLASSSTRKNVSLKKVLFFYIYHTDYYLREMEKLAEKVKREDYSGIDLELVRKLTHVSQNIELSLEKIDQILRKKK